MIKYCTRFLLALAFCPFFTFGQADTTETDTNFGFMSGRSVLPSTPLFRLELTGNIGLESKNFSTSNLLELTSTGFFDEAKKQDLLDDVNNRLSLGFQQSWSVGIFLQARKKGVLQKDIWGFSVYQKAYTSLGLPKSVFELALRGNKPFAGTTLDLSNTNFQSWLYTGLRYQFQFDIAKQSIQMASSIILGHSYTDYSLKDFSLYTEPDGAFVEIKGNYALREHTTQFDYGIAGMGTAIDISTDFKIGKKGKLSLAVSDIGIIYWTRGENVVNDTSFQFSGIEITNIFDIKDSLMRNQIEGIENQLWFNSSDYYLSLMPFKVQAVYQHSLAETGFTTIHTSVDYIYLPGYTPKAEVSTLFSTNKSHIFKGSVGYGGFNGFTVGAGYRWKVNNKLFVNAEILNVLGVVATNFGMGTVLSGGMYYYF